MTRSALANAGASAPVFGCKHGNDDARRFRLSCRLLRKCGALDHGGYDMYGQAVPLLPGQHRGESAIDWLVRLQLAASTHAAAEMLIEGRGLRTTLDELLALPNQF